MGSSPAQPAPARRSRIHAIAEQFSRIGVPVFVADVKGDLAGISQAGGDNEKVAERVKQLDVDRLRL